MFYTYPSAELPLPQELATDGERAWQWMELGLHVPRYLVTMRVGGEEGPLDRTLFLTDVKQVLLYAAGSDPGDQLVQVSLLSPYWMNDSEGYQLDIVHQVWTNQEQTVMVFVLAEGKRYRHDVYGQSDQVGDCDMSGLQLVLSV
jgi:hypothetical protein